MPHSSSSSVPGLDARSRDIRRTLVRMLEAAKRGHLASALSLVEILRVLFDDVMKFDAKNPQWADRDRFILSKGHGCLSLYALMAEKGFFPESELWKVGQANGILGGHPEYGRIPGVEASTGSLGHGLPIGLGFALAARFEKKKHRTFVVIGDGESNEGSVWEAALSASKHKLGNLVVLIDYNKFQSYGPTSEVQELEPFADKWRAFGFRTQEVDGHDVEALRRALKDTPIDSSQPHAIVCHTVKGKGFSFTENNLDWHHKNSLKPEEVQALMKELEDV